jgi:hypothetical protein
MRVATDVQLEGPAQKQFQKALHVVQAQLRRVARALAEDPQRGEYVPVSAVHNKGTIKKWRSRVGQVRNLYRLELAEGCRGLYTVGSRGPDRVVMILEVVDHKQYERLMGY